MSISEETVRHVARLAHLELQEDEVAPLVDELGRVLDFVACLKADAAPSGERPQGEAPLREDVDEAWPGLDATAEAPEARDGLFRVPPVMGG